MTAEEVITGLITDAEVRTSLTRPRRTNLKAFVQEPASPLVRKLKFTTVLHLSTGGAIVIAPHGEAPPEGSPLGAVLAVGAVVGLLAFGVTIGIAIGRATAPGEG